MRSRGPTTCCSRATGAALSFARSPACSDPLPGKARKPSRSKVRPSSRQALSLSLVLHELATNAAKYGALSVPEGRVRLSWWIEHKDEGRRVRLCWEERGGPPVSAPQATGFGTELIQRAFGFELDGTADLAFEPEGLRLEATIALT